MRPLRLELQGFTAFRDPTEVDLADAGLFAFTGPTGSGKSSLIDAMVFALYGSVPRYDDRRSVEPVVSLGREEARVRFDFTVGGREYTAARVVRRTRQGATTAEARLECDGEPPISGAKEVTEAVEDLLGLGFDHFTTCVVLPQGDFAEFLHDTGKGRRELLKKLLDLDVYAAVRSAASSRAKQAGDEARWVEERRAELAAGADEDAARSAAERLAGLEGIRDRVAAEEPELAEEDGRARALQATAREAAGRAATLASIRVPDGLEGTIDAVRSARDALGEADAALIAAEEGLADATTARQELPPMEVLRARRARHTDRAELAARRARGAEITAAAVTRLEEATATLAEAMRSADAARQTLRETERSRLAHVLAEGIEPGDTCPVCGRPVEEPPDLGVPAELDEARTAVDDAERRAREAESAQREAAVALERCRSTADAITEQLAAVERELGEERPEDVDRRIALAGAADERIDAARRARDEARAGQLEARRRFETAETSLASSWTAYDAARDAVASAGPPAPVRDDLAGSWVALAAWAAGEAREAEATATRLTEEAEAAVRAVSDRREALRVVLVDAGVDPAGRTPIEAVATALADARHEQDRILRAREEAEALAERVREAAEREAVARDLAYHLDGRRFEAWLLEEAFAALVEGANRRLDDLTGGAYSLAMEDQSFVIVDHRNADQRRGVKTLSGGETFLVSLALALALSEQLSELAAEGAARLESIFLDEGFGTLDGETLDLVASVLDELGASGRTVGIVTHVTELAERLPVRFELLKVGPTASVRRVEA